MAEKFTIDEAVSVGWSKFVQNIGPLLLFITLPQVVVAIIGEIPNIIVQVAAPALEKQPAVSLVLVGLALAWVPVKTVATVFIYMGSIRCALRAHDGKPFGFEQYTEGLPQFLNFVCAAFLVGCLTGLSVLIGLVPFSISALGAGVMSGAMKFEGVQFVGIAVMIFGALIGAIPMLITFVAFHWYPYLIVDKNSGPLQGIGGSIKLCSGAWMDLAILWLVIFAIHIAGALCLIIGIFPAMLISMLALAHVYRRLEQATPNTSS